MRIKTSICQALMSTLMVFASLCPSLLGQGLTNLAAASQGGYLYFFSSRYGDTWKAEHLIDGSANQGWAGQNKEAQSVIIGFKDSRLAEIEDILINPYTREDSSNWAKDVEIEISTTYPFKGFQPAGRFTLTNTGGDQAFSFPEPTRARFVKVRFLNNYGGGYMEAGEIQVMGRLLAEETPAPIFKSLADEAAGARVETFSSQYNDTGWATANLLKPDGSEQWAGTSGAAQEVVITLPEMVPVTDVSINNYAREDASNWAREVEVQLSSTAAYKGFTSVGTMNLPPVGDLHTLSLPQPVPARWVKVLFRANGGGGYMEAARIRVFQAETSGASSTAATQLEQQLVESGRAVVYEIHFATASAEILPSSETALKQIAEVLRSNTDLQLIIEGHTDNVGTAELNLELSRKRAESVRRWLVDREGIGEIRLTTVGYGLTRPITDNETEEGRAKNRRVELVRR